MAESLREADIISRKSVAQKVVPPCHGESATGFEPMAGIAIPHVGSSSLTPPPRNLRSLVTMQKMGKLQPARIDYYRVCLLEAFLWIFKCSSWNFKSHAYYILLGKFHHLAVPKRLVGRYNPNILVWIITPGRLET